MSYSFAAHLDSARKRIAKQPTGSAIDAEARALLRTEFAPPMTDAEAEAFCRGEPLPDHPFDRNAAERYVAENRNDGDYNGLLLDALTNDSRVMANLAKGNWTQLSVEWDRVFDAVVDDVARRGK